MTSEFQIIMTQCGTPRLWVQYYVRMDFISILFRRILTLIRRQMLFKRPFWGNQFWARGYCVDTVGLDLEMIREYVKHLEKEEKKSKKSLY